MLLARAPICRGADPDLWLLALCPARRSGSAPQGRSPVRAWPGAAERSGAALIHMRLNSATAVRRGDANCDV